MAVGYNNVDVNAAKNYGVAVCNTPVRFQFYWICFSTFIYYNDVCYKSGQLETTSLLHLGL